MANVQRLFIMLKIQIGHYGFHSHRVLYYFNNSICTELQFTTKYVGQFIFIILIIHLKLKKTCQMTNVWSFGAD